MLKPAQLYKERLNKEFIKTWYNPYYMYYSGYTGTGILDIPDNNIETHNFVSLDKNDKIIGYMAYSIDWASMQADKFGIISFDPENIVFARGIYQAIVDLFEKYHMNRISWLAYVENPATKAYRNFIKNHGGKECGYYREVGKLQDGKLHDAVRFEILACEFKR